MNKDIRIREIGLKISSKVVISNEDFVLLVESGVSTYSLSSTSLLANFDYYVLAKEADLLPPFLHYPFSNVALLLHDVHYFELAHV